MGTFQSASAGQSNTAPSQGQPIGVQPPNSLPSPGGAGMLRAGASGQGLVVQARGRSNLGLYLVAGAVALLAVVLIARP